MTVAYAILPNVRHGCDLTRPGGFGHLVLPACFALATTMALSYIICLARPRRNLRIASSHNGNVSSSRFYMSRWVIWLLKQGGPKECKASLVGQHANPRLCTANAPNRSLGSPPNCKRICKPSTEAIGPQTLRASSSDHS